jgi:predicted AAA+ superfamily ATPase
MYFSRHIEKVIERQAKRKAGVVITGARQVGKSTMLKNALPDVKYVSFDDPLLQESVKSNPNAFFDTHKLPIVIDEVQRIPEIFPYVKVVSDETDKKGLFYLTGSQSFHLMKGVSESLAGRVGVVQMLGLSQRELDQIDYREPFLPTAKHNKDMKALASKPDYLKTATRIHKGSFPELYQTQSDLKDWQDYHTGYLKTYLERDVRDLSKIQDESAFIKFVRATASLTGQQLSLSTLAEICGKDSGTIKNWLSILETSGLVYLLQPYYNNFNKRLTKTPKLYFLDTGLACFLLGWNTPEQLINGAMWGHIFETHVVAEVLKSYYNDGITNPPLYYYRDKEKREIDLLIESAGTLYPIEIKTSTDPKRDMIKSFEIISKIPAVRKGEGALICLSKELLPLSETDWILPVNMI